MDTMILALGVYIVKGSCGSNENFQYSKYQGVRI